MPIQSAEYTINRQQDVAEFEIKELFTDPDKFANLTDNFFAGMDEWVWTPIRNMQVFARKDFDAVFPEHQVNDVVALVIALLFGGIYYASYLYKLKHKQNNFNYNIVSLKLQQANPDKTSCSYTIDEVCRCIQAELEVVRAIWQEWYPDKYELFFVEDQRGSITAGNTQLRIVYKNPQPQQPVQQVKQDSNETDPLIAELQTPVRKAGWLARLENTFIAKTIFTAWDFLNRNALAYWIFWMGVAIFTGITTIAAAGTVLSGLMLGLPLLVPLTYYGLKLVKYIKAKNKDKAEIERAAEEEKKKAEIEQANRQVMQTYFLRKHAENVNQHLDKIASKNHETFNNIVCKLGLQPLQPSVIKHKRTKSPEALIKSGAYKCDAGYIKKIRSNKRKIFFAAVTGFFSGYLMASFAQWPITDLLTILPIVGVTAMAAPPAIIATAAITVAIALTYATYRGYKAYQAVKQKEQQLEELNYADRSVDHIKGLEHKIGCLKQSFNQMNQRVDKLVSSTNKLILQCQQHDAPLLKSEDFKGKNHYPSANNARFFDTLELKSKKTTWLKKIANRVANAVAGAGSGAFFVRSLLVGGVITLFVAVPLPAAVGIAAGIALTYGLVKAYQYHLNKQKLHEEDYIQGIQVRKECLRHEYEHLMKVHNQLQVNCEQLGQLQDSLQYKVSQQQMPECSYRWRSPLFKWHQNSGTDQERSVNVQFSNKSALTA